jgi:putative two-component system response regulator
VERVNSYSRAISEKLKGQWKWVDVDGHLVDNIFVEDIGMFAAYHDVGKIGTPEIILHKNGKLNEDEWKVMKEHPSNGALILDAHPNPMVKDIARSHHERWDGSGYPWGLNGEDIPLAGRIVAIADVYDALRTRRPYKKPFSEKKTADIIIEGAGTHFDPGLVEVFRELREDFERIFSELPD